MGGGCGAARGLSDENFPSNHYLMETRDRHLVARWGGKVADLKIGNGSVWNSSFWRANTELPMPGRLWLLQPRIVEATGAAGGLTAGDNGRQRATEWSRIREAHLCMYVQNSTALCS